MSLHISSSKLERGGTLVEHQGSLSTLFVYGNEANLMVATRTEGYHSKPHIHDCEQLNYLVDGELWIFMEEHAFHLKPGDFLRTPRNAVHWAWNRGPGPCTLVEVHCPVMDPTTRHGSYGLFAEGEPRTVNAVGPAQTVDFDSSVAEAKVSSTP